MTFDTPHAMAGLLVGTVVGLTGVGGGSLMTPLLVLMFHTAVKTAVGTDLLVASITKMFGTGVHQKHGSVDWQIVRRLAAGSLPAAAITLAWMTWGGAHKISDGAVIVSVGIALVVTAFGMLFKERLHALGTRFRVVDGEKFKRLQLPLTVVCGVVLGVLVTLTSIGAGALGTVMLVYLYPLRLDAGRLVGTDLAHAIPLALVAGMGHLFLGNVDYSLMFNLLVGSIPGVIVGAFISARAPIKLIRTFIALVLLLVASQMLTR